jgi:hypothetical protein
MTLHSYKDLDVWKRAVDLAVLADQLGDHLYVAIRAKRLDESQCAAAFELIDFVGRMLTNLLKALQRRLRVGRRESDSPRADVTSVSREPASSRPRSRRSEA